MPRKRKFEAIEPESWKQFDVYKVIPSLGKFRYSMRSLREYQMALWRQTVRMSKETGTLFDEPDPGEDDSIIHDYIGHIYQPKKALDYKARMKTEVERRTAGTDEKVGFIIKI